MPDHVADAEQLQSEMPNWTFFSEVPAARGPSFDDSAETKQSNWLKERSNPFLMAGKLQRTSDRLAYAFGEFSKKREQCPVHGPDFIKGAAKMSRIRFSQPQGAKRRDGQTTAATVRRFCSKGDDAVRNSVDPLG
ncbi:MAG: hypothetical protein EOQ86_06290 [Mesorhizobium sp.]|uniref:hypothetical protein n=1 Tax=Mesorhizobium sp. TaxID=1871066 RepID=UPI000FE883FA|nr:hypothetical protein [Mesorhizobium sp.]RWH81257.1 MAG: hypothetical protein EOQ85_09500 [Mesorhizobium sp.]RWH85770.1 MAG: hypothetical protein EOQ86_06290 [Mesorhizobium sp.]RWH91027.1 MAG: hypothetical protein EOQ87_09945 [Mesorhizobium sp.]RWH99709.1 MAG: hypothetical protein EOQ88_10050 [Mesorhizobium sp.]RWI04049.1 MAG: hypothetical protein EOQ89_10860 [Mesorhizobium sp.]